MDFKKGDMVRVVKNDGTYDWLKAMDAMCRSGGTYKVEDVHGEPGEVELINEFKDSYWFTAGCLERLESKHDEAPTMSPSEVENWGALIGVCRGPRETDEELRARVLAGFSESLIPTKPPNWLDRRFTFGEPYDAKAYGRIFRHQTKVPVHMMFAPGTWNAKNIPLGTSKEADKTFLNTFYDQHLGEPYEIEKKWHDDPTNIAECCGLWVDRRDPEEFQVVRIHETYDHMGLDQFKDRDEFEEEMQFYDNIDPIPEQCVPGYVRPEDKPRWTDAAVKRYPLVNRDWD